MFAQFFRTISGRRPTVGSMAQANARNAFVFARPGCRTAHARIAPRYARDRRWRRPHAGLRHAAAQSTRDLINNALRARRAARHRTPPRVAGSAATRVANLDTKNPLDDACGQKT